jgi:hypothetical protein
MHPPNTAIASIIQRRSTNPPPITRSPRRNRLCPTAAPRSNRHSARRRLTSTSRGFLPWRLSDDGPRARGTVSDGAVIRNPQHRLPRRLRWFDGKCTSESCLLAAPRVGSPGAICRRSCSSAQARLSGVPMALRRSAALARRRVESSVGRAELVSFMIRGISVQPRMTASQPSSLRRPMTCWK